MVICPIAPYGLAHGPKTCQIWHKLGLEFAERISLKLMDGLTPFKISWTCLDLWLCTVIVICPFAPYGLAHGPKTCQIWHKLGLEFAERISLKLMDGLTPFKISWTCLDLWLCTVIVICPFAPYGLAHGPKTCQIRQHLGQTLRNPYLWNPWMDLYHSKFYGIV